MTTTISSAVPILVYLALVPGIVWRARRRDAPRATLIAQLLLGGWVAALIALTLFPLPWRLGGGDMRIVSDPRGWPHPWASITPFETIGMSLQRGLGSLEGRVLIGNVVAFVPLGLLAPIVSARWRTAPRVLLLGLLVSTAVELAQLGWDLVVGMPWRAADIDDVIVNTFGALVGYGIWRLIPARLPRRAPVSA
jgi:glycopeptide antibiotics resistance protein